MEPLHGKRFTLLHATNNSIHFDDPIISSSGSAGVGHGGAAARFDKLEASCGFSFVNAPAFAVKALQKECRNGANAVERKGAPPPPGSGSSAAPAPPRPDDKGQRPPRVVIFDVDVHHGNGTQESFATDPNTLTISIHRGQLQYERLCGMDQAGTTLRDAKGNVLASVRGRNVAGAGEGFNVNLALLQNDGDFEVMCLIQFVVADIIRQFKPDMIICSLGYDALDRSALDVTVERPRDNASAEKTLQRTKERFAALDFSKRRRYAQCLANELRVYRGRKPFKKADRGQDVPASESDADDEPDDFIFDKRHRTFKEERFVNFGRKGGQGTDLGDADSGPRRIDGTTPGAGSWEHVGCPGCDCRFSPQVYGWIVSLCTTICGKIVLSSEGGYYYREMADYNSSYVRSSFFTSGPLRVFVQQDCDVPLGQDLHFFIFFHEMEKSNSIAPQSLPSEIRAQSGWQRSVELLACLARRRYRRYP